MVMIVCLSIYQLFVAFGALHYFFAIGPWDSGCVEAEWLNAQGSKAGLSIWHPFLQELIINMWCGRYLHSCRFLGGCTKKTKTVQWYSNWPPLTVHLGGWPKIPLNKKKPDFWGVLKKKQQGLLSYKKIDKTNINLMMMGLPKKRFIDLQPTPIQRGKNKEGIPDLHHACVSVFIQNGF